MPRLVPETGEERERYARAESQHRRQAAGMTGQPVALVLSGGGAKTAAHLGAVPGAEGGRVWPPALRGHLDGRGGRGGPGQRDGQR